MVSAIVLPHRRRRQTKGFKLDPTFIRQPVTFRSRIKNRLKHLSKILDSASPSPSSLYACQHTPCHLGCISQMAMRSRLKRLKARRFLWSRTACVTEEVHPWSVNTVWSYLPYFHAIPSGAVSLGSAAKKGHQRSSLCCRTRASPV